MLVVELVKKIHYKFMLSNVKSMPRIVSRLLACLVSDGLILAGLDDDLVQSNWKDACFRAEGVCV